MVKKKVDEQIERRIVRLLDGELDETEQSALLRELMRNPAAREMMDSYRGIDQASNEALKAVLRPRHVAESTHIPEALPRPRQRWPIRGAWAAAAGIALLVLGFVFSLSSHETWNDGQQVVFRDDLLDEALAEAQIQDAVEEALPTDGSASQIQIDREYVAYFDQKGNRLYLLEIDHELTSIENVSVDL